MKKLFSLLLCVVMVLSLVACGSKTDDTQTPDEPQDTAPELSGTMKVVATGDVYGPLFDAFTADTGVEVECLSMSSGEVLSKLRAEGGTPSADLWFGGGIDAFMSAKDDGLLEPVTFDAADELGDEYKDTEGYWYSKGITIVGFLLNNSLMEELGLTAPESWDDLTDSQYEGEIVMSNPAVSGTNYAVVNALLQAKGGYTKEQRQVIMVVVSRKQYPLLEHEVLRIDPNAFIIVTDTDEVHGLGFTYEEDDYT